VKKFFKITLVIAIVLFLVVTGAIAFIISGLPSSKKIGEGLKSVAPQRAVGPPTAAGVPPPASLPASVEASAALPAQATASSSADQTVSSTLTDEGIDDLMDPSKPMSDFCKNLKFSNFGKMKIQEFDQSFKESFKEDHQADARIEAVKPLIRSMFRQPRMQELIQEAMNAEAMADAGQTESFWNKAAFYSKAALAFQEMLAKKSEFEAIGDRSYIFIKLNDLVAKRPDLLNDQRVTKICDDTERAFNVGDPVQFDQEKRNFERVLAETGVNANEINYDPNYKTKFDIQFDGDSLTLKGGWLEDIVEEAPPTAQPPAGAPSSAPPIGP